MAGDMTQTEETDLSILGETKVQTDGGARMELTTLPRHRVLLVSLIAARRIKKPLEPVEFQDGDEDGEPARSYDLRLPPRSTNRTGLRSALASVMRNMSTGRLRWYLKRRRERAWNSHKFVRVNHAAQDLKVFLGTAGASCLCVVCARASVRRACASCVLVRARNKRSSHVLVLLASGRRGAQEGGRSAAQATRAGAGAKQRMS